MINIIFQIISTLLIIQYAETAPMRTGNLNAPSEIRVFRDETIPVALKENSEIYNDDQLTVSAPDDSGITSLFIQLGGKRRDVQPKVSLNVGSKIYRFSVPQDLSKKADTIKICEKRKNAATRCSVEFDFVNAPRPSQGGVAGFVASRPQFDPVDYYPLPKKGKLVTIPEAGESESDDFSGPLTSASTADSSTDTSDTVQSYCTQNQKNAIDSMKDGSNAKIFLQELKKKLPQFQSVTPDILAGLASESSGCSLDIPIDDAGSTPDTFVVNIRDKMRRLLKFIGKVVRVSDDEKVLRIKPISVSS